MMEGVRFGKLGVVFPCILGVGTASLDSHLCHDVRVSDLEGKVSNATTIGGKEPHTTVANVLLSAPMMNDNQGESLVMPFVLARRYKLFTRSKTPYVIAGLTVKTKPGLMPSQRPPTPSSSMISFATPKKESSKSASDSIGMLEVGRPTCCRVAITETGIVNI
jgi:hypothetical protein